MTFGIPASYSAGRATVRLRARLALGRWHSSGGTWVEQRETLEPLGVSIASEQVYRYFLRHPKRGIDAATSELALERDAVEVAYAELAALDLLRLSDDDEIVASDPRTGIERLIELRTQELNDELRRVARVRTVIPSLTGDQQIGQQGSLPAEIERIEGLDQIRARLEDLAFFARHEVLALQPDGPLTPAYIEAARALDRRCLRRGLVMRTVVYREAMTDALTLGYLRELVTLGAKIRVIDKAMDRMLIYDGSQAVVPLDPSNSSLGALLIRQPGLVSNMIVLFDKVWNEALDIEFDEDSAGEPDELTEIERQVLETLTRVDKDEIGAREMDMSVRTFRRYVADLMLRLGASNRFQAALLAKSRGWI